MANILSNFFNEVIQGDQLKDWDHASRLFVANNYELAPKNSFLYHVYFDLNQGAQLMNGMTDKNTQSEIGMLVKQVSLPKFTIDTKTLNAYNRNHIVQTKIHYDPVNIVFHDDSADRVRNFWYDYYTYYYRTSDYGTSGDLSAMNRARDEIHGNREKKDWGYTLRGSTTGNAVTAQYLNSIRIFSLHNKRFSEYVLVNPIIKSFQHGEHNASGSTDVMQHTMTIEYETVYYAYGATTKSSVSGFLDLHYDNRPSPLSPLGGGTQSITGVGGVLDSVSAITQDLESGNIVGALLTGGRVANGLNGASLGDMFKTDALSAVKGLITQSANPNGSIKLPTLSSLVSSANNVINNVTGAISSRITLPTLPPNLLAGGAAAVATVQAADVRAATTATNSALITPGVTYNDVDGTTDPAP